MKTSKLSLLTFAPLALIACQADSARVHVQDTTSPSLFGLLSIDDDDEGEDDEVVVALADIPAVVRAAAEAAAPGLVIHEAELEGSGDDAEYCVHGYVDGVFTEVEVSADGSRAEVEEDDDEDDEDDV